MKILLVEDDKILREILKNELKKHFQFEIVETESGIQAVNLSKDEEVKIVILDWELPDLDGIKVLNFLRKIYRKSYLYIIMLTGRNKKKDIIYGLNQGADDYLGKPFDLKELIARIKVGKRTILILDTLREKIIALENSIEEINILKGLLPICSYCKSIRVDENYWQKLEDYLLKKTGLKFSHGVCPECYSKHIEPRLKLQKIKRFGKIN